MNEQEMKGLEAVAQQCAEAEVVHLWPEKVIEMIAEIRRLKEEKSNAVKWIKREREKNSVLLDWQARAVVAMKDITALFFGLFASPHLSDKYKYEGVYKLIKQLIAEAEGGENGQ